MIIIKNLTNEIIKKTNNRQFMVSGKNEIEISVLSTLHNNSLIN